MRQWIAASLCAGVVSALLPNAALALDEAHYRQAREMIDKSIAYLRAAQDDETGGWGIRGEGPQFPGVTGLVLNGMLMEPEIDERDPSVSRGLDFILSFRQDDGGIYDRVLASYNTSMCLSALAGVNRPDAAAAIAPAQQFLKRIQWTDESIDHPETGRVDPSNPFYGGVGYGGGSRPDNSNLQLMLEGLRDSGLDCNDEAFKRALVFLQRTQMHHDVNDMPYAEGSTQGGFIYSTSPNADNVGVGESKAGMIEETLADGTRVERLRCYGSMTYAGFKSYVYANLDRDDERVQLAYEWIKRNYTLDENPGVGEQGLYYYYVTFSRALDALGLPYVETIQADGSIEPRDWANDLIDALAERQRSDGSFVNETDRWMEGDPTLVTGYALMALQHAIN
jgi:squalene-hopene/tetraprenyl-beta-curcumene cyclase